MQDLKYLRGKRKRWHDAHLRKILNYRAKINKREKRNIHTKHLPHPSKSNRYQHKFILCAPKVFSLSQNSEETREFFVDMDTKIKMCGVNDRLFFNLRDVQFVSIDAIMFFIAILNTNRRIRALRICCEGNVPLDPVARELIETSGFYSFVSHSAPTTISKETEKVQITEGLEADGVLSGKICDFVLHSVANDGFTSKRLYPMIIELMTNTAQHAYPDKGGTMGTHWFIFVENTDKVINFAFLDTGIGIPTTVRKKSFEKIAEVFRQSDAKYISSALRGECRSETKQPYRGKGLPEIYADVCNNRISNLSIQSGKGRCNISSDGTIEEVTYTTELQGTLFCWDYIK